MLLNRGLNVGEYVMLLKSGLIVGEIVGLGVRLFLRLLLFFVGPLEGGCVVPGGHVFVDGQGVFVGEPPGDDAEEGRGVGLGVLLFGGIDGRGVGLGVLLFGGLEGRGVGLGVLLFGGLSFGGLEGLGVGLGVLPLDVGLGVLLFGGLVGRLGDSLSKTTTLFEDVTKQST